MGVLNRFAILQSTTLALGSALVHQTLSCLVCVEDSKLISIKTQKIKI